MQFQSSITKMSEQTNGSSNGSRKVALITGITGQDGSYLAELLIEKGQVVSQYLRKINFKIDSIINLTQRQTFYRYEVHGIIRRSSSRNTGRIEHLYSDTRTHSEGSMKLHYGDLVDGKMFQFFRIEIQCVFYLHKFMVSKCLKLFYLQ